MVGATVVVVGATVVVTGATVVVVGAMVVVVGATVVVVVSGTVVVVVVVTGESDAKYVYASRFGLPAPILNNASTVAVAISFSFTSACVRSGFSSSIRAAMPLTIGAAFDVPLLER